MAPFALSFPSALLDTLDGVVEPGNTTTGYDGFLLSWCMIIIECTQSDVDNSRSSGCSRGGEVVENAYS